MADQPPISPMEYRRLGHSGLKVSAISLGAWLTFGGHVEEENAYACLSEAYKHGINFFDTAEGYSGGQSEIVIGRAIKKFGWRRCDVVISTKLNFGAANSVHRSRSQNTVGLSRKHIIEGTRASLDRLQLDYVDILYAHRPDVETPMEEVVRAFNHVIDRGWAFYWGTSEWSAAQIADAHRIAERLGLIGPLVEQPQYNLLAREKVEGEYLPLYAASHGLGLTTYSPLKFGILTGKYSDGNIPEDSRFGEKKAGVDPFTKSYREQFTVSEEVKKNIAVGGKLKELAEGLGVKPGQLAIAWLLKNKNVSSVITGATKPEQVAENVGAIKVVEKLTPEVMEKIEQIVGNKPTVVGTRIGVPPESVGVKLL